MAKLVAGRPVWHRVGLVAGRLVLSGGKGGMKPGRGVWVSALTREDGGQTTTEAIAVNGVEVWRGVCRCEWDRNQAWLRAGALCEWFSKGGR